MGNDLEISSGNMSESNTNALAEYNKQNNLPALPSQPSGDYLTTEKVGTDTELTEDVSAKKSRKSDIVPMKFWSKKIQKMFEECSQEQKRAWLDSFEIIEKGYAKQVRQLQATLDLAEPILKLLIPKIEGLKKIKMTPTEYVKLLLDFDVSLAKDPAYEVAKLIARFNLKYDDLAPLVPTAVDDVVTADRVKQQMQPLKDEINALRSQLNPSSEAMYDEETQDEIERQAETLVDQITMFYEQRDNKGNLLYPGAFKFAPEILELVEAGEDLDTAYHLVVKGKRPDELTDDSIEYQESDDGRKPVAKTAKEKEHDYLMSVLNQITRR
jgi:hypothetical protein